MVSKMFKIFIIKALSLTGLFLTSLTAFGQTQEATIFDESVIIYDRSVYGGAVLHTSGWGVNVSFTKNKGAFKSRLFQIDVVGMKHPKEVRSFNPYFEDTRSYIYGKLNNFFIIRPTIGKKYLKFDKIRKSGVAIGYNWRFGPSLGFTKPVYLEIGIPQEGSQFNIIDVIVEKYDPELHLPDNILGRASGLRGFDELGLQPGIHAAFGLNFEYDPEREGVKGIEVGATVDYYPFDEVEIMAFSQNKSLFFNFYISLQFGTKFNK